MYGLNKIFAMRPKSSRQNNRPNNTPASPPPLPPRKDKLVPTGESILPKYVETGSLNPRLNIAPMRGWMYSRNTSPEITKIRELPKPPKPRKQYVPISRSKVNANNIVINNSINRRINRLNKLNLYNHQMRDIKKLIKAILSSQNPREIAERIYYDSRRKAGISVFDFDVYNDLKKYNSQWGNIVDPELLGEIDDNLNNLLNQYNNISYENFQELSKRAKKYYSLGVISGFSTKPLTANSLDQYSTRLANLISGGVDDRSVDEFSQIMELNMFRLMDSNLLNQTAIKLGLNPIINNNEQPRRNNEQRLRNQQEKNTAAAAAIAAALEQAARNADALAAHAEQLRLETERAEQATRNAENAARREQNNNARSLALQQAANEEARRSEQLRLEAERATQEALEAEQRERELKEAVAIAEQLRLEAARAEEDARIANEEARRKQNNNARALAQQQANAAAALAKQLKQEANRAEQEVLETMQRAFANANANATNYESLQTMQRVFANANANATNYESLQTMQRVFANANANAAAATEAARIARAVALAAKEEAVRAEQAARNAANKAKRNANNAAATAAAEEAARIAEEEAVRAEQLRIEAEQAIEEARRAEEVRRQVIKQGRKNYKNSININRILNNEGVNYGIRSLYPNQEQVQSINNDIRNMEKSARIGQISRNICSITVNNIMQNYENVYSRESLLDDPNFKLNYNSMKIKNSSKINARLEVLPSIIERRPLSDESVELLKHIIRSTIRLKIYFTNCLGKELRVNIVRPGQLHVDVISSIADYIINNTKEAYLNELVDWNDRIKYILDERRVYIQDTVNYLDEIKERVKEIKKRKTIRGGSKKTAAKKSIKKSTKKSIKKSTKKSIKKSTKKSIKKSTKKSIKKSTKK
jgi:hypothetical protein